MAGAGPHLMSCGETLVCPSIVSAGVVKATPATATAAISVGNAIFMDNLLSRFDYLFFVLIGMTAKSRHFDSARELIVATDEPVGGGHPKVVSAIERLRRDVRHRPFMCPMNLLFHNRYEFCIRRHEPPPSAHFHCHRRCWRRRAGGRPAAHDAADRVAAGRGLGDRVRRSAV